MKVLLLESDANDAHKVIGCLRSRLSFDIDTIKTTAEAPALLRSVDYDVILAEFAMPETIGLAAINALQDACPEIPIISLGSVQNAQISAKAIAAGAQDFLSKETLLPCLLERSILHAIERQKSIHRLNQAITNLRSDHNLLVSENQALSQACQTAQQFVDNVSHEFRTPLTVIMEYASLIADSIAGPVNEEQRRMLNVIDDRAGDLNHMVDDMLDVSKIHSGLLGAARIPCSVEEIIRWPRRREGPTGRGARGRDRAR